MKFKSFEILEIKGNSEHFSKESRNDGNQMYVVHAIGEDGKLYQSSVMDEYELLNMQESLELHVIFKNIKVNY